MPARASAMPISSSPPTPPQSCGKCRGAKTSTQHQVHSTHRDHEPHVPRHPPTFNDEECVAKLAEGVLVLMAI
eukprot:4411869-Pyramimonas_sp.AAC.1